MANTDLRHLEGSAALRARIQALTFRVPNASQIAFASACLAHGRMFWESARQSPLETRPLLLYYGVAAYAKALIIATTACLPEALPQSHGMRCRSGASQAIADFQMTCEGHGLFQAFNDMVSARNRVTYFVDSDLQKKLCPTLRSPALHDLRITLADCFSRLPETNHGYRLSAQGPSNWIGFSLTHLGHYRIDVANDTLFIGREAMALAVAEIRAAAPFLHDWQLESAQHVWGSARFIFVNYTPPADELAIIAGGNSSFGAQIIPQFEFDPLPNIPPLTGGFRTSGLIGYMSPINGKEVSECSIRLAALLGLSSLVRYQPHIWTASVHRRMLANAAVDDRLLPVIEEFLETTLSTFPDFVATILFDR
jgi:hypothetical protein